MKQRRFIQNALVLTAATILMRSGGTVFMIYISNRIGAEGIGLYQLVSSVYALAVTLSTSGISLAVTRIVSEELALGHRAAARGAFLRSFAASIVLGTLAGLLLFGNAGNLGRYVVRDERTISAFLLLSGGLPFLSAASVIRGYFLGLQKPVKSVSGDAVEMLATMCITVPLLNLLLPRGLEAACCALVLGSVLAEAISCLYAVGLYWSDRIRRDGACPRGIGKRILSISVPIAASNYFRSFLTTIENVLVPPGLRKHGASDGEALAQYGAIKGMALPVLTLPAAIMSAFSSLLIPEVARAKALGAEGRINFIINKCMKATLLFAVWTMGIFFGFAEEIGNLLYPQEQIGRTIVLLTPLIPFLYLDQIVDSILKGLNQQLYSMKLNSADSLMRVILIYFLVPLCGVRGYLIMFYAGTILNASFSIGRLVSVGKVRFQVTDWLLKPGLATAVSCLLVRWIPGVPVIAQILLAGGIYCGVLYLLGCVTRRDIRWGMRALFPESVGRKGKCMLDKHRGV